ncbi:plasmid partitioning protein RepA [Acidisphaera sp. L21]|uniref:plasmid partitioning protein RepA n=1 Tax=Acidisphaera sp. L21 TaxID=1641851 RepID=UPI00131D22EF|nr:plasmid partitioning protein RepA [Acidisphaera sp. L21]
MDGVVGKDELYRDIDAIISAHAQNLSDKLQAHRLELFPPAAEKTLRPFQVSEAAKLLGVKSGYLRNLSLEGKGPSPQLSAGGRRSYTAAQIQELRHYLDANGRASRRYVPKRAEAEHLQVVAVVNFKGGSGKTTTAAHLTQHLALSGHRVLAVDLDPQASLSALFGFHPEYDVGLNETIYAALRYDDERRPLAEIIKPTNFPGLHIVPGNIELMEFEYDTPRMLAAQDGASGEPAFFARLHAALAEVADQYDVVVIDCPPQLGYLTMSALCAATGVLITVHPQMLDVMSMCQFLLMMGDILGHLKRAGGSMGYDWLRYLITRYEPSDGPQTQMVTFLRSLFDQYVLLHPMLKSVAISDAGITKQTLYEVERRQFTAATYDRAMESLDAVNGEIERLIHGAWGRT